MSQKIEIAKSIDDLKRILEWTMEETEIEGLEILSENESMTAIGLTPISSPNIIFRTFHGPSAIRSSGRVNSL